MLAGPASIFRSPLRSVPTAWRDRSSSRPIVMTQTSLPDSRRGTRRFLPRQQLGRQFRSSRWRCCPTQIDDG